ncbi:hypothetical protein PR048_004729 [Dryococelus australis]|uniref:HTH CENPB-type domain-containing protein n=1 Tax=Dryococelus australis TaxID=614101 RepID=A0ABQ9I7B4_9NEOP|nr:hypothetical protein PR048_004729 [Dryococelus australis]
MIAAIENVSADFSIKKVAEKNGVTRNTLSDKIKGKTPPGKKMGRDTCLMKEEEEMLVEWAISVGKEGFPITRGYLQNRYSNLQKNSTKNFSPKMVAQRENGANLS